MSRATSVDKDEKKMGALLWKMVWTFLQTMEIQLLFDQVMPQMGI